MGRSLCNASQNPNERQGWVHHHVPPPSFAVSLDLVHLCSPPTKRKQARIFKPVWDEEPSESLFLEWTERVSMMEEEPNDLID